MDTVPSQPEGTVLFSWKYIVIHSVGKMRYRKLDDKGKTLFDGVSAMLKF